jgi:chromosome segregation ATPase
MAEPETSLETELSEARRELAAREQEVQRLRGLLVRRDAELGQAKGKLAELETHVRRLMGAARRLSLLLRGILQLPATVLRRLAARRPSRG